MRSPDNICELLYIRGKGVPGEEFLLLPLGTKKQSFREEHSLIFRTVVTRGKAVHMLRTFRSDRHPATLPISHL